MSKLKAKTILGLASLASVAAIMLAVATPTPAEARVVCREGWGWQRDRCVEIRRDRGEFRHDNGKHRGWDRHSRYVVGGYLPRHTAWRALPRDRWARYERVPVGYRYVVVGDNVLLLDRRSRIVRIYD